MILNHKSFDNSQKFAIMGFVLSFYKKYFYWKKKLLDTINLNWFW